MSDSEDHKLDLKTDSKDSSLLSPSSTGSTAKERRKIEIKFIENKTRRHVTFSKRKHGIMKKAFELSVLTGTQVLLLVVSETGLVYTFSTPKFEPIVTQQEGRNLIQACLNAPDEEEEEEEETNKHENGNNAGSLIQQQQQQQQQQQLQQDQQQKQQQSPQMQQQPPQLQQHQQHPPPPQQQHSGILNNNNSANYMSVQQIQQPLKQVPFSNVNIQPPIPNNQYYQAQNPTQQQQQQNSVYQQYFQETQQTNY
ncbi:hypothetical protein TPHA_0C02530 [Tetrapisispora phaffii CBS 4417]|uniref:MADS-box domain-containing protein n=1 Tax=Tetrapisispora phaffii (strain ATCC 24235 / CBS 4417 / NBRC 1672 / NRRL Y-8282 / UCD 70-5) TaxID=1071381 RepID=G8BRN0_TETPH|nr:hypothetical protein TPHA_0C02530 [Tetrapisispora phaffii CBS 4417]CCE62406.1 hypothetical protein TPHA_0C02530 [Tetrapisispora phaffii CBS 4417]